MNSKTYWEPSPARFHLETGIADILKSNSLKQGKCLNLGCGTSGRYSELLQTFDVDGVDIAPTPQTTQPWRYHCCDAAKLPFESDSFDWIFSIETFEHIEKNKDAMAEAYRVLKPEGLMIVSTPTSATWLYEFGNHGPHYYSKNKLIALAETSGFTLLSIQGKGGFITYFTRLVKAWISPIGIRLIGNSWWRIINYILYPFYKISVNFDTFLSYPAVTWLMLLKKTKE